MMTWKEQKGDRSSMFSSISSVLSCKCCAFQHCHSELTIYLVDGCDESIQEKL